MVALDGVFDCSSVSMQRLNKLNLPGCSNIEDKQFVVIGYFFELGYELILAVNHNLSQNPVFKSCLGIFTSSD